MPTTDAQAPNPPRLAADRARRLWLARLASGWKEPVYVATTANVTLSNVQTIDGIAVPDGARVLVKDQTAGAENGIYEAKYGTWLRTGDADHPDKLGTATKVPVQRGTTNGGTTWRLTTTGTVTLGTTALTWAADGGSGGTLAGDVTGAIGSNSIAARAVTYAKMQAVSATARILGRTSSGAGDVEELTAAQTKALLAITASDVSDFNTAVRTNRLDQMAAPTGTVSMGAQFVSNVYAPFFGTDAANKTYVDTTTAAAVAAALTTAFDFKASVRAATTANITLSGAQTIDGVSVIAGDRVLVKNQTTGANNGIYVAAAGAWARATDADASAEVTAGLTVPVTEGTVNGGRMWMLSTADTITLGTTALTFTRVDTGDLQAASNLSDLVSVSTARTNLGLGTLALASTITSADITDGTIANGDLADMTTKTYKGRTAGTTGPPQDIAAATMATDLASQTAFTATYQSKLITSSTQTADYTPVDADVNTVVEVSKATVATITLPSSIAAGSCIEFQQTGAGQLAFVPGSGVSAVVAGGGRRATAGQYSSAVARKRSDGTWAIAGDLVLYDPTSIAGLVYWFKGGGTYWQDSGRTTPATADGDPVGAWDDASTGVAHAIQATAGARPVLKIGANGINSVPVVRFDGSDDFLASPASAATKPFTLFIVVKPSALPTTTNLAFPVGAATGGQGMYLDLNGKQGLDKTGTAAIGLSTTANSASTVLIMQATYSNTGVYTYYRNGAADGTGTNNQTFSATTVQIGKSAGDASVNGFFTGDIAEIIKYDTVLAAADLQAVENYLGGKYSVTVT